MDALYCKKCGGQLIKVSSEDFECEYCGSRFHDDSAAQQARAQAMAIEAKQQEKLNKLRRELYDRTHDKYIDSEAILRLCREVKDIDPDDFFASFFEVAALDQKNVANEIKLCKYIDNIDLGPFNQDLVDTLLDYMLKSLTSKNMASVGNLIEKAYHQKDPVKYGTYRTRYDQECEKVNNLVYDPTVNRDIFLCYASPDMDMVMEALNFFEDHGLTCFMAVRNMQHGNGAVANYWQVIHTAIDHCKAVVFLSSRNSRTNARDSKRELDYIVESDGNRKTPITRIELVIDPYTNEPAKRVVESVFKGYFEDGYSFNSVKEVYENVFDPDREKKKKQRECAAAPVISEEDMVLCDPFVKRDCFIAYDAEDEEKAQELVDFLEDEANCVTCFLESRNAKLWDKENQAEYSRKLRFAIDNCKCFVLVSTKSSRSYKSICKREMDYVLTTENERKVPLKKIHYVVDGMAGEKTEMYIRSFFGALEDVYLPDAVLSRFLTNDDKASKKKEKEPEPFDLSKVLPREVFVIYSDKDEARAEELVEFLEENGLTCFFRKRDFQGDYAELFKNLKTIINTCSSVAFVSSNDARTSVSNCKKELDAIKSYDVSRNEPIRKVEYLIDSYSGKPIDKVFQRFFLENNTYNSSPSSEEVFDKLLGVDEPVVEEEVKEEPKDITEEKEVKYCKFCGAENPLNTRYCCDCGETSFVETREEYLKLRRASKKELERIHENEYRDNSAGLKSNTIIYASSDKDDYNFENNTTKGGKPKANNDETPMERALADFYSDSSSSNKVKGGKNPKNSQPQKQEDDFDFASFYADGNKKSSNPKQKNNNNKADDDFDFASFYADGNKKSNNPKNSQPQKQEDDFDFASFYADGNSRSSANKNPKHRENSVARPVQNTHNRDYMPMPSLNRIELQVGQRIVVSENINQIMLAFKAQAKLDNFESNTFMFLLGEDDKVKSESDLIFFNNDSTISNSIVLTSEGKNSEKININLSKISNSIQKVAFVYSVVSNNGAKLNFSMASELEFLIDIGDNEYVMKINNIDRTSKSIYLFELYKYKNIWKVRVVGLPTNKDIDTICQEYGVDIA